MSYRSIYTVKKYNDDLRNISEEINKRQTINKQRLDKLQETNQIQKSKITKIYEKRKNAIFAECEKRLEGLKKAPKLQNTSEKLKNNKKSLFQFEKKKLSTKHKGDLINFVLKKRDEKLDHLNKWKSEKDEELLWSYSHFQKNLTTTLSSYELNFKAKAKAKLDQTKFRALAKKQQINQINYRAVNQLLVANELTYVPPIVFVANFWKNYFKKMQDNIYKKILSLQKLRYISLKQWVSFPVFGIPFWLYCLLFVMVAVSLYTNHVGSDILTGLGVLFVLSIIVGEITNRIPIWKKYLGGATIGCFIIGSVIATYGIIPAHQLAGVKSFFSGSTGGGFLNLYITVLLVGAIITIPRKLLLSSIGSYAGLLISGTSLAILVGFGLGRSLGVADHRNFLAIMAPLLGDGNGGGVQPLSQIAAETGYVHVVNGDNSFLGFALAVSSISNVIVIVFAAVLSSKMGNHPRLSGGGNLINKGIFVPKTNAVAKDRHVAIAIFIFAAIFIFSTFIEKVIEEHTKSVAFPKGLIISKFAWAIVIAVIFNTMKIIPEPVLEGAKKLTTFFSKQFTWFLMIGIGLITNLNSFTAVFSDYRNIVIIVFMDIALLIGPALIAKFLRCYVYESIITAGCCMGAQGGAGSIAVLTASNRMELLPYSQITCRVAGSLILVIASPLFTIFVNSGHHFTI